MFLKILKFMFLVFFWAAIFGAFIVACENDQQRNDEQNREWARHGGY